MGRNPLSCGAECSRITLITLNVLFLMCGIALLVLGLVFRFGGSELKDDIKPAFEHIELKGYDFYELVNNLAIIFIVVGAVIIILSVLGFIGAACLSTCALVLYAILIGLILALELAGVVLFFIMRTEFEDSVRRGMKKSIEQANDGNTDAQKGVNYLFEQFECCHVDQMRYTGSATCGTSITAYNKDCYDSLEEWIKNYQGAFIGIGIAVMVIQLICIVMACWLCRVSSREKNIAV